MTKFKGADRLDLKMRSPSIPRERHTPMGRRPQLRQFVAKPLPRLGARSKSLLDR
jgi:hypothetical protein